MSTNPDEFARFHKLLRESKGTVKYLEDKVIIVRRKDDRGDEQQ